MLELKRDNNMGPNFFRAIYLIEDDTELASLPVKSSPGSIAIVPGSDPSYYIKDLSEQWVEAESGQAVIMSNLF